ncbi:PhoPQ-activated protein PqaA family protein [Fluviispira sanaruensis]|uniref:PhoPQ-regulated protein n=1 Tax=Fluviispira sanaruensis TaxID=2493639 RepID=A0A4P2VN12_FLUSA|nr:PhoPQ-activated protein PqaA family protein [Fluviispira sanaruensis]BBH53320.1 PhoPQ-regulated protein [Fluviispira sanaruensis]
MNNKSFFTKIFALVFPISYAEESYTYTKCPENTDALDCSVFIQKQFPLDYKKISEEYLSPIKLLKLQLNSQRFPLHIETSQNKWSHTVSVYIPNNYDNKTNPFIYIDGGSSTKPDSSKINFSQVAIKTKSIIISINLVPNQPVSYPNKPNLVEDFLVAHTWKLYLENPEENKILPLQLPMAMSIIKTMDMLQKEPALSRYKMDSFILGGASKRGWAAWLTAIADTRIIAIVPIVIDIFNTENLINKFKTVYANNWPIALLPYYNEKLFQNIDKESYKKLMNILDPLAYKETSKKNRLDIPKLIISASGDDFFPPDNIFENYKELSGKSYFRYIPNSSHFVSYKVLEYSIISFLNRLNSQKSSKIFSFEFQENRTNKNQEIILKLNSSIKTISLWQAYNKYERDFRYACGIKYNKITYKIPKNRKLKITLEEPKIGWRASFLEVTDSDGFIQTTPNIVLPRNKFPESIDTNKIENCRVLPLP